MVSWTFGPCTSSQWSKNAWMSAPGFAGTSDTCFRNPLRVQGKGGLSVSGASGSAPSTNTHSRVAQGQ